MKHREWNNTLEATDEVAVADRTQRHRDTMWSYEQFRAGKLYNKVVFNTRKEAEDFANEMTRIQPDLFCRIEPIEAREVWN
jgi:hypothetical protein